MTDTCKPTIRTEFTEMDLFDMIRYIKTTPQQHKDLCISINPTFTGSITEKPITIGELELLTQQEKESLPLIYFINGKEVSKEKFNNLIAFS